jgi:TP901 family phage tail tape measure protein
MDIAGDAVQNLGQKAVEAAKEIVEVGSSFESSMSNVAALSGAAGSELEELSAKAQELGRNTQFSASEVADAFSYMALAGWDTQSMLSGVDGVLNLAAAAQMGLASASDIVTDNLTAFGLSADDSTKFVDQMAYAMANSNTDVEQLGEAYKNCAATASSMGYSVEDTTAALMVMANAGIKGGEAGTGLSSIMTRLATNTKNCADILGEYGVQIYDTNGNMNSLSDILNGCAGIWGDLTQEEQANLAKVIAGTSQYSKFQTVMSGLGDQATKNGQSFNDYSEALKKCDGAASDMASTMTDNLSGDIAAYNSAVEGLGIALYDYIDGPVRSVVQGVTDGINGITDALNPQKTELETFISDISAATDEIEKTLERSKNLTADAYSNVNELEAYKELLLDLNEKEQMNAYEQYQVKDAIEALGDSVPGLAEAYDEVNGKFTITNEEMSSMFENAEKLILQQAMMEAQTEAYKALSEAKIATAEANAAATSAEEKYNTAIEKNNKTIGAQNSYMGDYSDEVAEATGEVGKAREAQKKAGEQYEKAQEQVDVLAGAYEELQEELGLTEESTDDLTDSQEEATDAAGDAADATKELSEAQKEAAKAGAEAQKEAARSILEAYNGYVSEIQSDLQNKFSLFDKFEGGTDVTFEETVEAIKSNVDGLAQYKENLAKIKDEVGNTISPEFMRYIEDMGLEGANLLEHMVKTMSQDNWEDLFREASDSYMEYFDMTDEIAEAGAANQTAYELAMGELGSTEIDWSDLRDSIDTAVSNAAEGWEALPEATRTELENTIEAARECGVQIPDGLADGIESGEISPESAIAELNGTIQGTLEGLVEIAEKAGVNIPEDLKAGIESGGQDAVDACSRLVALISSESGNLQTALADGAKTDEVANAVESSMNAGASKVSEASGTYKSKASEVMTETAEGLSEGTELIQETLDTVLQAGADKIGEYEEIYRQAGETLGTVMAEGFQEVLDAAVDQLDLSKLEGKKTDFQSIGNSWTDETAAGMSAESSKIENAAGEILKAADEVFSSAQQSSKTSGEASGNRYVEGLQSKKDAASTAGSLLTAAVTEAYSKQQSAHTSAGGTSGNRYVEGLLSIRGSASSAGSSIGSAAYGGASGYYQSFYAAGRNMTSGMESGIYAGKSSVVTAVVNMATSALKAAKNALGIHSPSRKFQNEVGKQVGTGFAFGIKDSASLAGKQAEKMSSTVFTKATSWLTKYKSKQKVSIQDEIYYWKQIQKHTKQGTEAYNNIVKKLNVLNLKSAVGTDMTKLVLSNFGVSKTTTTGSGDNKKTVKKEAETYYSEIYSAAEKYLSNYQVLHDMSLQQEKAYWVGVRKQLKSGTQAWYDATKEINSLSEQMEEAKQAKITETANTQSKILESYKSYYKLSAKAETEYWNIARKQFKQGTDERIEADNKYLEAKQEYYDQLQELDEDYQKNTQEINEQLEENIKELQDAYKDAVKSRKEDILSSMNLFEAWDSTGYDADTLLYNLKTQVAGLTMWEQQLEELGQKGLSESLMEELQSMGPDAAASIYSLNQMTAEQLDEYEKLWEQKNALAESQAVKENESLREETNQEITELRAEAKAELKTLSADYKAALNELNTGLSDELKNLVTQANTIGSDSVAGLIQGIRNASEEPQNIVEIYKSTTKISNTLTTGLSTLPDEGKILGENTLSGILEGLMDQSKIDSAAQDVVDSIKRAMQDAADIHSPSRLFRDAVGVQISAGVGEGIADGTQAAVQSAEQLMEETMEAAKEEMQRQQENLQANVGTLSFAGITKLNNLIEQTQPQTPVINVDNTGITTVLQQALDGIQDMVAAIQNMQMVTDTGVLCGVMQPLISQESAAVAVRNSRGGRR